MLPKNSVPRIFSVSLILMFILMTADGAYPVPVKIDEVSSVVQFAAGGHALGFSSQGLYVAAGNHALHVSFVGANSIQPQSDSLAKADIIEKSTPLDRVVYANLWDDITLAYTPSVNGIYATTYTLSPGADVKKIRLCYNAPLSLSRNGYLNITFDTGIMTESAPVAWQNIQGRRVPVDVSFLVQGQEVGFVLGTYNPGYPLTIDPTLAWNTFLGGNGGDFGMNLTLDESGNIFVTGYSDSAWGSPMHAYAFGGSDAYVAKLDSSGNLIWNTFLGGSGDDVGLDVIVSAGNVYVTGYSNTAWDCTPISCTVRAYTSGDYDTFVAKLNSSGDLKWNSFLGGGGADFGHGITVDGSGNIYVSGASGATWGSPLQAYSGGGYDGFAAKLDASGSLTWNTFQGGSGDDQSLDIAVDGNRNVYVTGYSNATWGSPLRIYANNYDGFAAKLDDSGALVWNTFLGGGLEDHGHSISVDGTGGVYVAGYSNGTWGNPVRAYTSGNDVFAVKLTSLGQLVWNSFLGGSGADSGSAITLDGNANVYVTGYSTDGWGSPLQAYTSGFDAFVTRLDSSGVVNWNTFLGGGGGDFGNGIALDGSNNLYITGYSDSTWGSPLQAFTGGTDTYVTKINGDPLPPPVPIFADVPFSYWANHWIEILYNNGITSGCNSMPLIYCPESEVTRAQMAVFLLKAMHGSGFIPPAVGSGTGFTDVATDYWAATWIKQLAAEGITGGCGAGIYCPEDPVTRAQMAVFLLKAKHGSSYAPPNVSATFTDTAAHWAADWIEQLAAEGITSGCAGGLYCPENPVTRAQMAVFLVKAFGLP